MMTFKKKEWHGKEQNIFFILKICEVIDKIITNFVVFSEFERSIMVETFIP